MYLEQHLPQLLAPLLDDLWLRCQQVLQLYARSQVPVVAHVLGLCVEVVDLLREAHAAQDSLGVSHSPLAAQTAGKVRTNCNGLGQCRAAARQGCCKARVHACHNQAALRQCSIGCHMMRATGRSAL